MFVFPLNPLLPPLQSRKISVVYFIIIFFSLFFLSRPLFLFFSFSFSLACITQSAILDTFAVPSSAPVDGLTVGHSPAIPLPRELITNCSRGPVQVVPAGRLSRLHKQIQFRFRAIWCRSPSDWSKPRPYCVPPAL